jgi:hypothetical protein
MLFVGNILRLQIGGGESINETIKCRLNELMIQ